MTFSIVARDPASGDLGVAVASRFLASGSVVPWARADVGAIATQALGNVTYGPVGLALLEAGSDAATTLQRLVTADRLAHHRQVGIVDRNGGAATWTGHACNAWAGGRTTDGVAAQGNILTGPAVVDALVETYLATAGRFTDRLTSALLAADRAGGDSRGRQSAALLIVRTGGGYLGADDRWLDLRVDDHPDPVVELTRLTAIHRLLWERPLVEDLLPIDAALAAELQQLLDALGVAADPLVIDDTELLAELGLAEQVGTPRPLPDSWTPAWQARLDGWMGNQNLEMRAAASGWLDPEIVTLLRQSATSEG